MPNRRRHPLSSDFNGDQVIESLTMAPQTGTREPMPGGFRDGALYIFETPVSYSVAWALQSQFHHERLYQERPDTVVILEHQPVYTMGRSTRPSDWRVDEQTLRTNGTELRCVNRGGSVTFHGPGQIVVYPILKVAEYAPGPRRLVWLLEEVIIRFLARWNIEGCRMAHMPGVWIPSPVPAKIASIGIRIQRGVSLHGFALNVEMDLTPFQIIHPCGLRDCRMTTMGNLGKTGLPLTEMKRDLAQTFGEVFGVEWTTMVQIPGSHGIVAEEPFVSTPRSSRSTRDYAGT